ncbi:MAG: T9SS type A sorting domain-containing protein [Bacteroidia bacterium]
MKKLITLFFFSLVISNISFAQYPVGFVSTTYNDPARSRDVTCWIYYPGVAAGQNQTVATGSFPVIVFGHGFVMGYDAYSNIWNALVPKGYIVVLPTTESSFSPVHANFGGDIAFLAAKMQSEGANNSSPFYQRVAPKSGVMGHSMGGGSSFLAAENNTSITTMVTLAAAVTNPSSVTAAANITIPSLTIAGQDDCVAPPADHQTLMYNALASTCKTYITINNGSHCFFAQNNFNCNFGEGTCNPVPDIDRADQQDAAADMFTLWFDHWLKDDCQAWEDLQDSMAVSPRITSQQSCTQPTPSVGMNGMYLEATPAGTYYQWYYEGTIIPGANGQLHQPDQPGNYSVGVNYSTNCPVMSAPYPYNVTGINTALAEEITVLPTFADDLIQVNRTNGKGKLDIGIFDTAGKLLLQTSTVNQQTVINISSLSTGLYFINFTSENGTNHLQKIVKR